MGENLGHEGRGGRSRRERSGRGLMFSPARRRRNVVERKSMSEAIVAQKAPYAKELEAGKTYYWCACGRSANQPFCDGSHKAVGMAPRPSPPRRRERPISAAASIRRMRPIATVRTRACERRRNRANAGGHPAGLSRSWRWSWIIFSSSEAAAIRSPASSRKNHCFLELGRLTDPVTPIRLSQFRGQFRTPSMFDVCS